MFLGYDPWYMRAGEEAKKRISFQPYNTDYFGFMGQFKRMKPWTHIVPLTDNPFNRAKSNISALEAIYAGAIPIVPDWEEWQIPGAMRYNSFESFGETVKTAMAIQPKAHIFLWDMCISWIRENRILSVTNQARIEALR
jgi:hypothetical protein